MSSPASHAAPGPDSTVEPSRALVPLAPPVAAARPAARASRPLAPFLAHLIATSRRLPQTTLKRRTAPETAISAYGTAAARPAYAGAAVRRSI